MTSPLDAPRVLIIDDQEGIREIFKAFLELGGYAVLTASDYVSALEQLSHSIDIVFSDIILETQSGLEILREIKDRGLLCPVIIMTGVPNLETAREAIRLGAFDYLSKPIRKETLLRIASQALRHKRLVDEKTSIEAEKERYRQNLEAIFRSVQDVIITVDQQMRVIAANDATERLLDVNCPEIIGRQLEDVVGDPFMPCYTVLQETLRTKEAIREYRIEWVSKQHGNQVVVLNTAPLIDSSNSFVGAVLSIRDITRLASLERELRQRYEFHKIVGKSKKMQEIYALAEILSETESTVLITGESGTGKELVAEAIHYSGNRTLKPLVKVNCSALAENLLESELFGHVKGAFTGAVKDKVGRFEMANGGTILLDEIGDISPLIQIKLLRVLQEKEFERVGDSTPLKSDVRIIASTNCDLRAKIRQGKFREDLYYRLKVVEFGLPPLRERLDDIPLLVEHFCHFFNRKFSKHIEGISDDVLTLFMSYHWPGNVRELEHVIEHAFLLCPGHTITRAYLPTEVREHVPVHAHQMAKADAHLPQTIMDALSQTGWNKARAARLLGMSRQTLYRKLIELNLPARPEVPQH